jgi:hypothetical protein
MLLLEWLYSTNDDGALLLYPRMLPSSNVIATLLGEWTNYNIVVVTNARAELVNWTQGLSYQIVPYHDTSTITDYLHNASVDIIIFDDIHHLNTTSPTIKFSPHLPKLLVLSTWGDARGDVDVLTSMIPKLSLLYFKVSQDIADITWKKIVTHMSERQISYYNRARAVDLIQTRTLEYASSRRVSLYSEPDRLVCDLSEHITHNPSDTLQLNGAKLYAIIDTVSSFAPTKQILLSTSCIDIIHTALHHYARHRLIPYDEQQLYIVQNGMSEALQYQKLKDFSNAKDGILITNLTKLPSDIILNRVQILHITDGYEMHPLRTFIRHVHTRLNKISSDKLCTPLQVLFHVAIHPREKSADEILYDKLESEIESANSVYYGLSVQADNVVYIPQTGLSVLSYPSVTCRK